MPSDFFSRDDPLAENMAQDPALSARKLSKPPLPKKFYKAATIEEREEGLCLALDGRVAKTPAKNALIIPSPGLGDALCAEWNAQTAEIDPSSMPLTRLLNSAIDGVRGKEALVAADIVKQADGDCLYYRDDSDDRLSERQRLCWDPVIDWIEVTLGIRPTLIAGIMPQSQPDELFSAVKTQIEGSGFFKLAALHSMTTVLESVALTLAVDQRRLSAEEAWTFAHLDEDYQIETWGRDPEAEHRRAFRWTEMTAAALLLENAAG